jgi:hypothetical protein
MAAGAIPPPQFFERAIVRAKPSEQIARAGLFPENGIVRNTLKHNFVDPAFGRPARPGPNT